MTAEIWARAKINLSLGIVGRRADGYHLLSSVMQSVTLADRVIVKRMPGHGPKTELWTSLPYVPRDGRNTAWKAVEAFAAHTGLPVRVRIDVHKAVPVGAGLAGGSTDAAAVLRLLDRLYATNLPEETLATLGLSVGADVPFCLSGGTKLAEGVGEVLTALPPLPFCHIVLCKPPVSLKTREIFQAYDALPAREPDNWALLDALVKQDLSAVAAQLSNALLTPALACCRQIESILAFLRESGALGAMMSGSGPTVFGLFASRRKAEQAAARLKTKYRETFLTHPVRENPRKKENL